MQKKKGEIKKSKRLCRIELANIIKDSKNFFKYFNYKNQKSSIGPLHEEGEIILRLQKCLRVIPYQVVQF